MKSIVRAVIAFLSLAVVAGALVWGYLANRSDEDSNDAPIEAASRIGRQNGRTILTFDEQAQKANDIVVSALGAVRYSASEQANGVVLDLQPLLDLKTSLAAAQAELAKARASAQASAAEYKRLRGLNENSQNVAQKTVEAARAAAESDEATVQNAQQSLANLENSMELRWGKVLAGWIQHGSPQLEALLAQKEFLLQVASAASAEPREAVLTLPDGSHAAAELIGALPQVDPRLQAPSVLYLVAARPEIVPGMYLAVSLPSGPRSNGVLVPYGAIVWIDGNAWCYIETDPGKFMRTVVPTGNPAPAGWFVSQGIAAGAKVVTAGAQTLYSEEFRSQIQTDED